MDPQPGSSSASAIATDENGRDIALMERVAGGDRQAFEELLHRHQHAVVGTVAKMLGNPSDCEDIAQQVFLRVWKSAPRYKPSAKFTTWLFTITRNMVFNEMRRRQRRPAVSLEEREEQLLSFHAASEDPSPDDSALHSELEQAVDAAIHRLPEKQRMAVVLRRYQELPYEEIAEVLQLTVPAVKSVLFRARAQLKEDLRQYLDG